MLLLLLSHVKDLVLTVNGSYFIPAGSIRLMMTVIDIMIKNRDVLESARSGVFVDPIVNIDSPLLAKSTQTFNPTIFKESNLDFETLGIGGIDEQFKEMFRRAFASRSLHPDELKRLGIKHQKGILLYGPPGTGKTTLARALCKILNSHPPVIVNGPEVLNKFVGASEENVRMLFRPAENEYKEKGDYSQLHVIIFDEFDAICRQRTSSSESGNNVGNTIVNQLLAKIDGVDSLNNILLIGMTNRRDMIDDAILRPGRFGVHLEISLPDTFGRLQILKIHTKSIRENRLLHSNVSLEAYAEMTENYSGAELELLVQDATSYLISRQLDLKNIKSINTLVGQVTAEDFELAFSKIKPKYGRNEHEFLVPNELVEYDTFTSVRTHIIELINKLKSSSRINLITVLLHGEAGVGKSTIASSINGFPFARIIRADKLLKHKMESAKAGEIHNCFLDAYKSPLSYIVLDDLERLMEFMNIGPRFSTTILQTLIVLLSTPPPNGGKLFIVATSSNIEAIESLDMIKLFNEVIEIPKLNYDEIAKFTPNYDGVNISVRDLIFKID
jgi:vesicle-fusing ATPase